jgi:hypothetical protein
MLQSDRDTVTHGATILIFTDSSHSWICLSSPAVESPCQVRSRACRQSDHLYECRSSYVPRFISLSKIKMSRDITSSRDPEKERLLLDEGVRAQIVRRRLASNYRVVTIFLMNLEQSCVACERLQLVNVRRVGRA